MSWTRILRCMMTDLRVGLSSQQIGYLLIAPLLMAGLLKLLTPMIEGAKPTVVAAGAFHRVELEALQSRTHVLWVKDRDAVVRRVEGIDDVVGVFGVQDQDPEVIFEGNEPQDLRTYPGLVLNETTAALEGGTSLQMTLTQVAAVSGRTRTTDLTIVLLASLLIVALFPGLTIIEDRQTHAIDTLRVSPLTFGEYALAKALLIVDLTLVSAVAVVLILVDGPVAWGNLLAATLAMLPTGLFFAALLGALARDQMAAMTIIKIAIPLLLAIPVAGFFIGADSTWMLAPLTPYWAGQALFAALTSDVESLGNALLLSGVTGIPLVLASVALLRRRLAWSER